MVKYEESLKHQLERVDDYRRNNDTIVYLVFAAFAAANGVLVNAFFQNYNQSCLVSPQLIQEVAVCLVGIILSVFWDVLQTRSIKFLKFYETLSSDIEQRLGEIKNNDENGILRPSPYKEFKIRAYDRENNSEFCPDQISDECFTNERYKQCIGKGSMKRIFKRIPFFCVIIWIGAIVVIFFTSVKI